MQRSRTNHDQKKMTKRKEITTMARTLVHDAMEDVG